MDPLSFFAGAYIIVGMWAVAFTVGWGVGLGLRAAGFGRHNQNDL